MRIRNNSIFNLPDSLRHRTEKYYEKQQQKNLLRFL